MTIQEIFNCPAVREIELQIILLLRKSEKNGRSGDADSIALTHLLKVRKNLFDSMFIMNDEYNALLSEFNDAMTEQLLEMRKQTIQMRDAILNINIEGNEIEAVEKCFLGYEYPKNHPIQTYRAKAIWFDREMTKDMHLTRVFHNIYEHMEFSIFDLLWVRDFNIEVSVEVDSSSYPTGYEEEDIDPHKDYSKILNNE